MRALGLLLLLSGSAFADLATTPSRAEIRAAPIFGALRRKALVIEPTPVVEIAKPPQLGSHGELRGSGAGTWRTGRLAIGGPGVIATGDRADEHAVPPDPRLISCGFPAEARFSTPGEKVEERAR